MSQDLRNFANAFPDIQEARNRADYDPTASFYISNVQSLIDAAETAMDAFDRAGDAEKADVLALMLVGARG